MTWWARWWWCSTKSLNGPMPRPLFHIGRLYAVWYSGMAFGVRPTGRGVDIGRLAIGWWRRR